MTAFVLRAVRELRDNGYMSDATLATLTMDERALALALASAERAGEEAHA